MSQKVLIITDDFPPKNGGGASIVASIHAESLYKRGYEVIVLTTVEDSAKTGESTENGIRIIRIYSKYSPRYRSYLSLFNPFITSTIRNILKKEKPDITHFHNIHFHFSYHSIFIARKYSKKVFITIHDSMPFHYSKLFPKYPYEMPIKSYRISLLRQLKDFKFRFNPLKNILVRCYLRIPDKIFAVSNALKKALLDNGIKNVEVIHNGIDVDRWHSDEKIIENLKKEYNLLDKKIIMFCGRLSRAKGGELMVDCMPDIINSIPNATLLVVGDKDIEALNMLKRATELNIDTNLVFTGKLTGNSIISAFGACDMLVVPSLCFDWFPTVNLEAMAMKKPIVATCFGGSSEAVSEKVNGYIVNPYRKNEVIETIVKMLNDIEQSKKFGNAGYEKVCNEFSISSYIEKTLYWYNKI